MPSRLDFNVDSPRAINPPSLLYDFHRATINLKETTGWFLDDGVVESIAS
jgi:hypothetical protein